MVVFFYGARRLKSIRRMRADYELFNQQLCILGRNELKIFRGYLSGEKDIGEIAEEEGIQYESAAQRVRRAKVKIKLDRFISPVYEALLREDEFFGMWSSKENVWR